VRSSSRERLAPRTLAGRGAAAASRGLHARRRLLLVMASVQQGTGWLLHARPCEATWQRARAQVEAFLQSLAQAGMLACAAPAESWFVLCDERLNRPRDGTAAAAQLLYGVALTRPGEFQAVLVTHESQGSRSRPVSVNRQARRGAELEREFEAAILRGLAAG
jgi:phage tail sheath protein FI